ncbi:hypothetical protein [Actinoplanes ianthinogenes]|uniref:hypothetical protein n=2 Tax=Actinoplanes ianthinogenes TaxID=122358 RepID=UPI001BB439BB|nr:hypothetical protein [Actinoplanes ianthinogenes]
MPPTTAGSGRKTGKRSGTSRVPRPREAIRDYDGLFKALLEANPKDTLRLLCGVEVDEAVVIVDGPTEINRKRSMHMDKVFAALATDGIVDIHHIEVQVQRTADFQVRMVGYWVGLADKYDESKHRIHQTVIWPDGGGYPGSFQRDCLSLDYRVVNVPEDLDPEEVLRTPLAPLALWSTRRPPDVVERVADRIAAQTDPEQRLVQTEMSLLAAEDIARQIVTALRSRGMRFNLAETEVGREIAEENLNLGREEGLVRSMTLFLQSRFGEFAGLEDLARKLVADDHAANVARIMSGASLNELRKS